MINQSDINYIVSELSNAIKQKDWELVIEMKEYIIEFQDDPQLEEE